MPRNIRKKVCEAVVCWWNYAFSLSFYFWKITVSWKWVQWVEGNNFVREPVERNMTHPQCFPVELVGIINSLDNIFVLHFSSKRFSRFPKQLSARRFFSSRQINFITKVFFFLAFKTSWKFSNIHWFVVGLVVIDETRVRLWRKFDEIQFVLDWRKIVKEKIWKEKLETVRNFRKTQFNFNWIFNWRFYAAWYFNLRVNF